MAHSDKETLRLKKALEELSADFTALEPAMKEVLEVCEIAFDRTHDIREVEWLVSCALEEVAYRRGHLDIEEMIK